MFEANTAALEGGKYGIAFGSGMAAVSAVVHLLSANDRVVCTNDLYGGSNRYFTRVAKQSGNYDFCFVDTCSVESVAKAVTKNTKLVWIETPTNPLMRIVDIEVSALLGCLCRETIRFLPYLQRIFFGMDASSRMVLCMDVCELY